MPSPECVRSSCRYLPFHIDLTSQKPYLQQAVSPNGSARALDERNYRDNGRILVLIEKSWPTFFGGGMQHASEKGRQAADFRFHAFRFITSRANTTQESRAKPGMLGFSPIPGEKKRCPSILFRELLRGVWDGKNAQI